MAIFVPFVSPKSHNGNPIEHYYKLCEAKTDCMEMMMKGMWDKKTTTKKQQCIP